MLLSEFLILNQRHTLPLAYVNFLHFNILYLMHNYVPPKSILACYVTQIKGNKSQYIFTLPKGQFLEFAACKVFLEQQQQHLLLPPLLVVLILLFLLLLLLMSWGGMISFRFLLHCNENGKQQAPLKMDITFLHSHFKLVRGDNYADGIIADI